jgi:hypothetical protein
LDLGPELRGDPLDSGLGRLHVLRQQLLSARCFCPSAWARRGGAFVLEKVGSLLSSARASSRDAGGSAFEGRSARLRSLAQLLGFRRARAASPYKWWTDCTSFSRSSRSAASALVGRLKLLTFSRAST